MLVVKEKYWMFSAVHMVKVLIHEFVGAISTPG